MKKIPLLALSATLLFFSCNNSSTAGKETETGKTDSLMHEVMEGHDAVMPKMSKVRAAQAEAKRLIDSIATLPAKTQDQAAALKSRLEQLVNELDYANSSMDDWMSKFNMDSFENDINARVNYLVNEKMKISKVKENVMNGLSKADSLLKKSF